MRAPAFFGFALTLAATIHIDWHLARPTHHRLSLGWHQHWIFAAIVFFGVGWIMARLRAKDAVHAALWIAIVGIMPGQGIEPVLELVIYQGHVGYPTDPGRWGVFFACIAVGLPALLTSARLCRRRDSESSAAAQVK